MKQRLVSTKFSLLYLASKYLKVFSVKTVSNDKADVNFLIYFVDGIVNRPSSRSCLYKLNDAFPHKTQRDKRSGQKQSSKGVLQKGCS